MKCSNCGSLDIHTDTARGSVYCGECGMVQEENTVVSTLQFDSSSAKTVLHGKMVNVENTNIGTQFIDSSYYIKNTIRSICNKLSLGNTHIDAAFRWYKLCLQYSLSKGKSILYTLSACVYITCRQESTPHLLIDFSNELRIDLFKIGKVFLKLRNLLGVDIPLIDPSLYMHRFVSQLRFQNKEILTFSTLLVSRMKKDWILEGRRPNNSCGAALLIASRIFGEERDVDEIARVVHASAAIINKRLQEIKDTESADLQIDKFRDLWIEKEENPPIYKKHVKAEAAMIDSKKLHLATPFSQSEESDSVELKYEDFFDVDDLILGEEEAKDRAAVWDSMYGDFLKESLSKKKKVRSTAIKRHSKRHNFETVEEAFLSLDKKVSSKLNYSALENLFNPS